MENLALQIVESNQNTQSILDTKQDPKLIIQAVYELLQNRQIHPSGKFDRAGRFYALHDDLISVRSPSRAWPFSHMTACRTKKYVKKVAEKFECKTIAELIKSV